MYVSLYKFNLYALWIDIFRQISIILLSKWTGAATRAINDLVSLEFEHPTTRCCTNIARACWIILKSQ